MLLSTPLVSPNFGQFQDQHFFLLVMNPDGKNSKSACMCVCFCQGLWVRIVWQHIPARNWMMTGNSSHKHDGLPKMRWGDPVGRVCYASCSCCFPFLRELQSWWELWKLFVFTVGNWSCYLKWCVLFSGTFRTSLQVSELGFIASTSKPGV